jgi:hypothetical protein
MAKPGDPSIERPDMHGAGEAGELYCWVSQTRECGADCPAFDERALTNPEIKPCSVLNGMRSIAISLDRLARAKGISVQPAPPPVHPGGKT